jgi:hypothetical protein
MRLLRCFAEPVIGPRDFARVQWLAMTVNSALDLIAIVPMRKQERTQHDDERDREVNVQLRVLQRGRELPANAVDCGKKSSAVAHCCPKPPRRVSGRLIEKRRQWLRKRAKVWHADAPVTRTRTALLISTLFEIKGEGYADLLQSSIIEGSIKEKFLGQALGQVQASDGRPIIWVFAESEAELYAQELFQNDDRLKRIYVVWVPWVK